MSLLTESPVRRASASRKCQETLYVLSGSLSAWSSVPLNPTPSAPRSIVKRKDDLPFPPTPKSLHFFQSLFLIFDPSPTPIGNGPTFPTYGSPLPCPPSSGLPLGVPADAGPFFCDSFASLSRRCCVDVEGSGSCFGVWIARVLDDTRIRRADLRRGEVMSRVACSVMVIALIA